MRFYAQRHQFTCGIDLHARTMYLWILDRDGKTVYHANLPATAAALVQALSPYHDTSEGTCGDTSGGGGGDVVVAVECMFAWYWVADVCEAHGIHFALGHALYMKAIHGGKHKHDKLDAQKIAKLTYGGNLPLAYTYPAPMRATRDLMRRRGFFVRQRALLLTHIQTTCQQYNLPAFNKRIAYKANRVGVADHFRDLDPSVGEMVQTDLAMIDQIDTQVRQLELSITRRAKGHDTRTYHRLLSIPGVGKVLSLVMLYEIHDIGRFERVQDFLSYARLVRSKKTSAGKASGGASGKKIGNAHLKWAISEATLLLMRESEAAKKFVERKTRRFGKGKAIGILSAKLGRAIYQLLVREEPFDEKRFFANC